MPASEIRPKVMKMSRVNAQLVAIIAVDLADGNFELIYSFFSRSELVNLRFVAPDGEEIESISDMFPGAMNFEREIIDLFGLRFKGIPGGLMLTPESGIVAPLRKSSSPSTPASRERKGANHG
jgi:NADH:ubiquinone oxidoreductase subunit C